MRHSFISVAAYASLIFALSEAQAFAGNKYDKTIEQAAINIAVEKLGDIRGSHDIKEPLYLYPPIEARNAANGMLQPAELQDKTVIAPASLQGN
ncbi:MAG: hypothetical protein AAGC96_07795 [Pseudomonadota bacterium]